MSLLETLKTEKAKLEKQLEQFKADPAVAARIAELKVELAKLSESVNGSAIRSQIVALDKAILAIESPDKATRPMSEQGRTAIKAGLQRYHENRKKAAEAAPAPPVAPVAPGGEQHVAKRK